MIELPKDFDPETENLILEYQIVALEDIYPNPWNPNEMTAREEAALAESMRVYGDFDPITVRPHPELSGGYQIIDGEHRWKTRVADGKKYALVNIKTANETEAQHLTGITILDRGTPDKLKLAQLLAEVEHNSDQAQTLEGLPMTQNELEELLKLAEHDWQTEYDREPTPKPERNTPATTASTPETPPPADQTTPQTLPAGEWVTFSVTMTHEAHRAYLDAYKLIQEADGNLDQKSNIAHGQVIEALSAEYLSGTNYAKPNDS